MAIFIFNRFHVESSEKITDKLQFMMDGMITKSSTGYGKFAYKLVEVEIKDNFIYGYLIKYDPYSIDEVYDEKNSKLATDTMRNRIIAKSLFIIDYKESLMIFEEVPNHISKTTFRDRFTELFIENHSEKRIVKIDISGIVEHYTFLQKVKELKKVQKIVLNLVPSNPRFAEEWEDVDKRLRENNIGKYKEIQETKNNAGIKVDKETESKILMTEDGYGDSKVYGVDENNVPTTLSTETRQRTISLNVPRNILDQGIVSVVNFMNSVLNKIKDRTTNGKN